jgi:hypothetical protein
MRRSRRVLLLLGLAFAAGNAVAFAHAWRFTHFVDGAKRTDNPERLGVVARATVLLTGVTVARPVEQDLRAQVLPDARDERVGDAAVWVDPAGADARGVVLLFHGYGGSRSDLLGDAAFFHALGYGVAAVGFPGSGAAAGDSTSLGYGEADVVRDVAAHYRTGAPLVLYGKSMGSAAILRAVGVLGVRADALILENPFDRLVTTVGHRFEAMGLPAFPGAWILAFWGGVQHGFYGPGYAPVEDAVHVTVPTLLLHGAEDARVHLDEARAIDAALGGPHRLEVFPGVGHVGLRTQDPARWGAAVREWLGAIPFERGAPD